MTLGAFSRLNNGGFVALLAGNIWQSGHPAADGRSEGVLR
jgi:hypothetical protein